MYETIFSILTMIVYLLAAALATGLVWLIVTRIGVERMQRISRELAANQELAAAAVRYAQQVYFNLDGPIRYIKAQEWMVNECMRLGMTVTLDQVRGLIEGALRTFKDEFGEEWGKALDDATTGITA